MRNWESVVEGEGHGDGELEEAGLSGGFGGRRGRCGPCNWLLQGRLQGDMNAQKQGNGKIKAGWRDARRRKKSR